jgi:glycine cleavage system H lipoate-binding protein
MHSPDIVTMYSSKLLEYFLAVAYLVSFVVFWRYLNGGQKAPAAVRAARPALDLVEGFRVPAELLFHPGHTWARPAAEGGFVLVGMSDFAKKLLGQVSPMLPQPGTKLTQGDKAFAFEADGRRVQMVSPVDGEVVEVNPAPQADGWLVKVRADRFAANARQLLKGEAARRWTREAVAALSAYQSHGLGAVAADGGMPVDGLARAVAPESWDKLAAEHFLTADESAAETR